VESIDHDGAKKAKQKKNVLSVVINERFYSVHSKAQRKVGPACHPYIRLILFIGLVLWFKQVPVPEDLNLDEAFDGDSLDRLLEVEVLIPMWLLISTTIYDTYMCMIWCVCVQIPDNLQLASLYLVKPPSQVLPNFDLFVQSEEDSGRAKSLHSSMPEIFEDNGGGNGTGTRYREIITLRLSFIHSFFVQIITRFSRDAQRLQDRRTERARERYNLHDSIISTRL